ncbi:MAG: PIN domain-containing protein [Bacteroidia bacterium]|jgi:predicted nucleic acid-binding protein
MTDRIFVDSDIVLDLLSGRLPHYNAAAELFSLADEGSVKLFVSSLSFANVNYILSRQYNANQARKKLLKLKTLISILSVNEKIIELALSSEFRDFEDAIQYYTAIENDLTLLLTRNLKDFRKADISVLTAEQYLKSFE